MKVLMAVLCAWVLMRPFVSVDEPGWRKVWHAIWYRNTWEIVEVFNDEASCRARAAKAQNEGMEATGGRPIDAKWVDFHLALIKSRCVPASLADKLGVSIRPSVFVLPL